MKWLMDVLMLFGEWLLIMLIPLFLGLAIGWFLWYRALKKGEVEKQTMARELKNCRNEKESISLSRSEELQAMKLKLHKCREEETQAIEAKNQEIEGLKESLSQCQEEHMLELKAREEEAKAKADLEDHKNLDRMDSEDQDIDLVDHEQIEMFFDNAFERQLAEASKDLPVGYEDDLKQINGVGPKMEKMLKDFGVRTFYQLSMFDADGIAALNEKIDAFPGRIERDDWIGQAKVLYEKVNKEA